MEVAIKQIMPRRSRGFVAVWQTISKRLAWHLRGTVMDSSSVGKLLDGRPRKPGGTLRERSEFGIVEHARRPGLVLPKSIE